MTNDPRDGNTGAGPQPPPQQYPAQYGYQPPPAGPPGYGWAPPPGFSPAPSAPKAPPKKRWYVVGAALLALGIIVIAVSVGAIVSVVGNSPADEDLFGSGEFVTVPFAAGETKVVFADVGGAEGHTVNCNVAARPGDSVRMERFDGSLTLNEWDAVFTVTAQDAAEYRITCTGQPGDTFGVGGDTSVGAFVGAIFGVFAGGGLAFAGVVVLAVALFLRYRRGSAGGR